MILTNINELKNEALTIIHSLENGEDIIITKNGKPFAVINPINTTIIQKEKKRISLQGIVDNYDITDADIEEVKRIWK